MNNLNVHELLPGMHRRLSPAFDRLFEKNPHFGPLIFLDTETTGMRDSDVIELGAVAVGPRHDGSGIFIDAFSQLINPGPGLAMPPWVIEIHGMTNEMLRKHGRPPLQVFNRFIEWADGISPSHFVAHSAAFDRGMLAGDLSKHGIEYQLPEFKCTVKLAKGLPVENRKLGTLARHFGFANRQAHRALADAEACAYIYACILNAMPLKGHVAAVMGDLPTLTRSEAEDLLRKYGARVVSRATRNTTLAVVGNGCEAKVERARELGVEVRDEAWLLGMGDG